MSTRERGRAAAFRAVVGMALSGLGGGCELLAGLPDVTDGRSTASSGGAGGGGSTACAAAGSGGCAPGECTPALFFEGAQPSGLAIHRGTLHWGTVDSVVAASLDPKQIVATWEAADPPDVAVDDSGVYWGEANTECIRRAPLDGGPADEGSIGGCVGAYGGEIALDETHVYLAVGPQDQDGCKDGPPCCGPENTGCVFRVAKEGGDPMFYTDSRTGTGALLLDGPFVYWAVTGQIQRCAREGCDGSPEVVVDGAGTVSGMALDGTVLYWQTAEQGDLRRRDILRAGSDVELVDDQGNYGKGITFDDTHVYWASGTQVFRRAKTLKEPAEPLGGAKAEEVLVDCSGIYWTELAASAQGPAGIYRVPR